MKNIDTIKRDIDWLLNRFYQVYAGIIRVPEKEKQKLLDRYEACFHNARQILANLKEAERLIRNIESLN